MPSTDLSDRWNKGAILPQRTPRFNRSTARGSTQQNQGLRSIDVPEGSRVMMRQKQRRFSTVASITQAQMTTDNDNDLIIIQRGYLNLRSSAQDHSFNLEIHKINNAFSTNPGGLMQEFKRTGEGRSKLHFGHRGASIPVPLRLHLLCKR